VSREVFKSLPQICGIDVFIEQHDGVPGFNAAKLQHYDQGRDPDGVTLTPRS